MDERDKACKLQIYEIYDERKRKKYMTIYEKYMK